MWAEEDDRHPDNMSHNITATHQRRSQYNSPGDMDDRYIVGVIFNGPRDECNIIRNTKRKSSTL